jgi:ABC-type uncharacterized transport system ATPase subunit
VRLIRKLKEDNHSVIVISHDLHDVVLEVADRIVVLRLGRKVAEFRREEVNASDLVAGDTIPFQSPNRRNCGLGMEPSRGDRIFIQGNVKWLGVQI